MKHPKNVVVFPRKNLCHVRVVHELPATVIILPVVRIERTPNSPNSRRRKIKIA